MWVVLARCTSLLRSHNPSINPAGAESPPNERIEMNILQIRTAVALGVMFALTCTPSTLADATATTPAIASGAQKELKLAGSLLGIDLQERTVTVKSFGFKRTFLAGDSCSVSLADKPEATLAELRPGQKVVITYTKLDGVSIARQIAQQNQVFSGHITALDATSKKLTVKRGLTKRDFVVAPNASLRFADAQSGSLEDLKIGHTVNVVYEEQDGLRAHQIEQRRETFVGTIRAIDASRKTVKARNLINERTFHLVSGCQIVIENRPGGRLHDLRIGDRVALTYEEADGVLLVNRIGRTDYAGEPATDQAAGVSNH